MTATITTEREFLLRGIDRAYDGLTTGQQQQALDFMRLLHLANRIDPESTGELLRSFHPADKTDVDTAYRQLLSISAAAVNAKLIKPAANDD